MFTGNQRLTHTISTLLNVGTIGVEQRTPTNRRTLENIIRRQTDTIRPRPKPPSSPVNLPTPRDILSFTETVTRVTEYHHGSLHSLPGIAHYPRRGHTHTLFASPQRVGTLVRDVVPIIHSHSTRIESKLPSLLRITGMTSSQERNTTLSHRRGRCTRLILSGGSDRDGVEWPRRSSSATTVQHHGIRVGKRLHTRASFVDRIMWMLREIALNENAYART